MPSWSSPKRSLIARRSRSTSMYSSGSVCSWPASKAGVSDSASVARLALELLEPLAVVGDEALDGLSRAAWRRTSSTWPGRDEASPRVTRLARTS